MKKIKYLLLIFTIFFVVGCSKQNVTSTNQKNDQSKNTDEIILYYGETCSHCKVIEKYISDNKIDQKINLKQKEVFNNLENASELVDKASSCGIKDTTKIGVPFLYYKSKCLMGDEDIIKFFENENK